MTTERDVAKRFERERARRTGAAGKPDDAATPQEKLVRAAESGRFEAIVAAAQPAEPPKMVTPEEREAALRASGQWPSDAAKEKAKAAPPAEPEPPPEPEPGMPPEPTVGVRWAEEKVFWRKRSSRPSLPYGRSITEYDVITGELIGDGYLRYDDEEER